jgi:hypothetical protein
VSTGSFTPLSATPPMTPRLGHEIAESLSSSCAGPEPLYGPSLGDQPQLLTRALLPHQLQQQQQQHAMAPIATVIQPGSTSTSSSTSSSGTVLPSVYGGLLIENDPLVSASGGFVSSPISYQPPLNALSISSGQTMQSFHATFPEDSFQNMYMPALMEDNKATSPTLGAHGAGAATTGFGTRGSLMQQQQYQQQQMAQFQEDMEGSNGNTNTAIGHDGHNQASPPLTTAGAIAAALARSSAPPIEPRPRDRTVSMAETNGPASSTTTSPATTVAATAGHVPAHRFGGLNSADGEGQSPHPSHQGSIAQHSPYNPLGGSSTFFPTRANTTLAASHLITHDVRQSSEHSHIEDGAGPVVLMAIGKTGQGKSSLLNKIMGTNELKASASVRVSFASSLLYLLSLGCCSHIFFQS